MQITRGKTDEAQKVVVYGPEGIGKSSFAAQFPEPVFIDTEGSTGHMNVARLPKPTSFTMVMEEIKYIRDNPSVCRTLVIDTADWAEQLCISQFCASKQISGIEDIGYGKGYVYIAENFGKMLNLLEEVKAKGINIVITAHAMMRKFEQPDELGAYDRWELKLQKKTAPLLKEWADMVLFANYKTIVVNVDNQGAQKGKNKAQGGKRVMYTTHHVCWDAKNRHGLQEELPFEYAQIAHCIPVIGEKTKTPKNTQASVPEEKMKQETNEKQTEKAESVMETQKEDTKEESKLPKKLLDLMKSKTVSEKDIQDVVTLRGYYPKGTPVENYDPDFIEGVLIGAWEKVYAMINKMKLERGDFVSVDENLPDEMPFN